MSNKAPDIPENMRHLDQWRSSRRSFLKGIALAGLWATFPWLPACDNETSPTTLTLSPQQLSCLHAVQNILLPSDDFGPSAEDIHAMDYLQWVLTDESLSHEDRNFIAQGASWLNKMAQKEHSHSFADIEHKEQELMVARISAKDWGETWLSVLMTFLLEALLSDPVYGSNNKEQGWKWLQHRGGQPGATTALMHGHFLNTVNTNS